jgi:hypothetical protein
LNAVRALYGYEREFKEFIMRIHTGETVAAATTDWTWDQRMKLGQRLLKDLSEDILVLNKKRALIPRTLEQTLPMLIAQLELDGYIFRDYKLLFSEAAVLDVESEEGILEKIITDLQLENQEIMKHHLDLSGAHYVDGKWGDSISNSRKFLESVLQEITAVHHLLKVRKRIDPNIYSEPVRVREYLETQGLLEAKEKKALAGVYGLLSGTGSHPYIAEKDQARLMRYLALTFAQFVLLRFQGFIAKHKQP